MNECKFTVTTNLKRYSRTYTAKDLDEITEILKQLRKKHEDLNQRIETLTVEMDPDAELRLSVRYETERRVASEEQKDTTREHEAARSMRRRAANTVAQEWPKAPPGSSTQTTTDEFNQVFQAVRALPLLPEGGRDDVHYTITGGYTECGLDTEDVDISITWLDVTCTQCLRIREGGDI